MTRRWTRTAMLAVVALALVASAGAFTTVEADRVASVTVVDDESAYLGLTEYRSIATRDTEVPASGDAGDAPDQNTVATSGSVGTIFEVTNQFTRELTAVGATATADHPDLTVTVEDGHTPASLGVGERGEVEARIECDSVVRDAPVRFTVAVRGDGVEASRLDKTVRITCTPNGLSDDGSASANAGAAQTPASKTEATPPSETPTPTPTERPR